jgi:hypothetical protein
LAERFFAVELGVEVGVVGGEPVLAFLCCAAVFTVLEERSCQDKVLGHKVVGRVWARTYFWWEGADAAVDYFLCRPQVCRGSFGFCHVKNELGSGVWFLVLRSGEGLEG